jgi:hypothetical protein
MGQKLSISHEQEQELYNLFQVGQPQKSQASPETSPVVMMRMMAPTALGPKRSVMQPSPPVKKQRAIEPTAKVRRVSVRQAQQVGQRRQRKM